MNFDEEKILFRVIGFVFLIFIIEFVASIPEFHAFGNYSHINEDVEFKFNVSSNVTIDGGDSADSSIVYSILQINSTEYISNTTPDFYGWISINTSNGILFFNSTADNETGQFNLSIQILNLDSLGESRPFYFIVNVTNDAPNFTNIHGEYNLTQSSEFFDYLNATDEEEHYPLVFNVTFNGTCVHASWSGRSENENCSLYDFGFSITNVTNMSYSMNFTAAKNDVGTYYANISVMDFGNSTAYGCPHVYCDNSVYERNKTTYYSKIVKFNIFATLEINATTCENKIFQENSSGVCQMNITTKQENSPLNLSSLAFLRNFNGGVSNLTWFYPNTTLTASNFLVTLNINITPQKAEVGNWTINFSITDESSGQNLTDEFYVYVNRTYNALPNFTDISDVDTSIDLQTIINLTIYDDDLLIPDKNSSSGGYNETISFNITIFNQSDTSQFLILPNFSVTILGMPVSNGGVPTNKTTAEIRFTINSSNAGNYTVNITINDSQNVLDSEFFNLSIKSNIFPSWNQTNYTWILIVNSTIGTTVQFEPINLTGDNYVYDPGDTLTFTNNSNAFPKFNLTSNGMVDFTPWKKDIGYWSFSVTATDSLGLQNATTFIFNISNINSAPIIEMPVSPINASGNSNIGINATEDNYTTMELWIQDEDFRVATSQKTYYNETFTINLTIEGPNTNLFDFSNSTIDTSWPIPGNNRTRYAPTFTPNKTDAGNYNITINVTDSGGASIVLKFNFSIITSQHSPVLMELTNQTSSINTTFYYDINATDSEDGADTSGNLTFSYEFLSDASTNDFINNNESIFNTTSGVLTILFSDSQAGLYHLNITVNDTNSSIDFDNFWLSVYDFPNITFQFSSYNFSLQENVTSNLTFRANHSVGDNLTYFIYVNNFLKYNISYFGNNTNLTWQFTPNFTDETYGAYKNLSLVVFPTNANFVNRTDFNSSQVWNVNITHSNAPVVFSGHIGDKQATYGTDIEINLTQYFSDIDYSDTYYNQSLNFTVSSNSSLSYISSSVSSDLVLTLSASIAVREILNIMGNDSSTNDTSNNFIVQFTTPTTTTVTTTSSSSNTVTKPVSLKIIVPDPISAFKKDKIVLPITLNNTGEQDLSGITLIGSVTKDNVFRNDILVAFSKDYFDSLKKGTTKDVMLTIDINTDEVGTYEITIDANVKSPVYHDWAKLYITVKEGTEIEERLVFTEEFIASNPECLELRELIEEAKRYAAEGRMDLAREKTEEALNACKEAIEQPGTTRIRELMEDKLYRYLVIATLFAFLTGISYYSYRRIKLKRSTIKNIVSRQEKIIKIRESIK
ncbi:MAG: hypothetical protein KKF48_02440 [Nanoarchaeota archaeon]|nr:hypothetical protein [Nanoarchaeota archaeon]MBU1027879.1 hypothetical protein [Nanoarchaeota archaeon]